MQVFVDFITSKNFNKTNQSWKKEQKIGFEERNKTSRLTKCVSRKTGNSIKSEETKEGVENVIVLD